MNEKTKTFQYTYHMIKRHTRIQLYIIRLTTIIQYLRKVFKFLKTRNDKLE